MWDGKSTIDDDYLTQLLSAQGWHQKGNDDMVYSLGSRFIVDERLQHRWMGLGGSGM